MVPRVNKQAMADILLILAEFYKYPDENFYQELVSGALCLELQHLMQAVGFVLECPLGNLAVGGLEDLKMEYVKSFIGTGRPAAVPVESVYKVWTTDKSAKISIAGQKGYLMGDSALHMAYLLNSMGFEVPEEFRSMPDHLCLMLELLAYMIKDCSSQDVCLYLQEHFHWLEDFEQRLIEIGGSEFYLQATKLLRQCVKRTAELLTQT
ncbi:MAG: molecular chaperone TorD family protein [Bacillota bacterium]